MKEFLQAEKQTVVRAWKEGLRLDMRAADEPRPVTVEFPFSDRGKVMLRVGESVVIGCVSCELVDPTPTAPKHGFLDFGCKGDVTKTESSDIIAAMELLLKRGRALDTESLCVRPGRKVWSLRVDVTVLNNDGNILDVALWGALAALMHFRRQELSIRGEEVIIHSVDDRDPIPLSIHHFPIPVTSTLDREGGAFFVDPTGAEAAAGKGNVTVAMNAESEVCWISKRGGLGVPYELIQQCIQAARKVSAVLYALFLQEIRADEVKRKKASLEKFSWAQKRVGVGRMENPGSASDAAAPKPEGASEPKRSRLE